MAPNPSNKSTCNHHLKTHEPYHLTQNSPPIGINEATLCSGLESNRRISFDASVVTEVSCDTTSCASVAAAELAQHIKMHCLTNRSNVARTSNGKDHEDAISLLDTDHNSYNDRVRNAKREISPIELDTMPLQKGTKRPKVSGLYKLTESTEQKDITANMSLDQRQKYHMRPPAIYHTSSRGSVRQYSGAFSKTEAGRITNEISQRTLDVNLSRGRTRRIPPHDELPECLHYVAGKLVQSIDKMPVEEPLWFPSSIQNIDDQGYKADNEKSIK